MFRHPGPDGVTRFFVDAAHLLRGAGMAASPDHLIAASRMAETLSVLRGRPRPGLDEVLDSADAVMGGLPLVRRRLVVGEAIGEVPPGAPQVPLARDLLVRQRRGAAEAAFRRRRGRARPAHAERTRARSHLLHQLVALGVGWGALEEGRGTSGTFRETWRVAWEPELSVRLVELAGHGTTVEQAATNRLVERATTADGLLELAAALDLALLAHLPLAVGPIVVQLSARAANDPDVGQLMAALGPLAQAQRYGDVRATDVSALRTVFDGLGRARARRRRRRVRIARRRGGAGDGRAPERRAGRAGADRPSGAARRAPRGARPARRRTCPRPRPGPGHPSAARRRRLGRGAGRAPARPGALVRHAARGRRRVRRRVPRRQRHGAAPRRRPARPRRPVAVVVGTRRVHRRDPAAASHVRCVRTGRAPPARPPARRRSPRGASRVSVPTSIRRGPRPRCVRCDSRSASPSAPTAGVEHPP